LEIYLTDEGMIQHEWNEAESQIIVENNRLLYGTLAIAQSQLLNLESEGVSGEESEETNLEDEELKEDEKNE